MKDRPSFATNKSKLKQLSDIRYCIIDLFNQKDQIQNDILLYEKNVFKDQVLEILAQTPADVLKQYHSGARIQPISGWSMKDVHRMSESQLAYVQGIGPTSAYLIKQCSKKYVQTVIDQTKLNISPNDRTANESKLVKRIFQFDKLRLLSEEGKRLISIIPTQDEAKKAEPAARPIIWLFSNSPAKEDALKEISTIDNLLQPALLDEVELLKTKMDHNQRTY